MENFVGIDLGTTNSAICTFDKETQQTRVWKSPEQNDVTPSAIYIDRRGNERVGQEAYMAKARNPDNCATLFKRFMGTSTPIELSAVDRTFTPEECSAKVLKTLFGYLPEEIRDLPDTGTVITVPAAFDQMQKNATMAAAEMAGIGKVELVQEPVAAVMSFMKVSDSSDGIFLIYDLGGGTLDIAIAENIKKRVAILAHGGIRLCGGRDFDRKIFDNIVRPWLHEKFDLPDDLANNPTYKPLLGLATWATERAKIELSSKNESIISLYEGEIGTNDLTGDEIYLDIPLDRNTYDELIAEQIAETIEAARETLSKTGYTPNDIECIVWVGGPTHYKPLRDKVAFELGIRGDRLDVNPMTAVAIGASIIAESTDWNAAKVRDKKNQEEVLSKSNSDSEFTFNFNYRDRTPDDTTKIAVQLEGQVPNGTEFQVDSLDSAWTSGRIPLKHGQTVDVTLINTGSNTFKISVYDNLGKSIKHEEIIIRKVDISIDKIPSELSIALEVVSNQVDVGNIGKVDVGNIGKESELAFLVKEGELLPKEGKITVYAGQILEAGSSNSLNFKLQEIDSMGRRKPMALLRIYGTDFAEGSIPVNTLLNCFYKKSLGGNIEFEVEVDIGGNIKTFDEVLYIDEDSTPSPVQIFEKGRHTLTRIDHIQKLVGDDPKLEQAKKKIETAIMLEENESDNEKIMQAHDANLTAQKLLDQVEKDPENRKKIRQIDFDRVINNFDVNIRQFARSSEALEFDKLADTAQRSIDNNDDDFHEHVGELRSRIYQILWRQDWFVIEQFNYFAYSPHLFTNQDRFEELVHIGNRLMEHPEIQDILAGKRVTTLKSEVVEQLRRIIGQMYEILRDSQDVISVSPEVITNILKERKNLE